MAPGTAAPVAAQVTDPASDTSESPLAADAVAGVTDARLAALLRDHWEWSMQRSPTWATSLGDHRYDNRLGDLGPAAVQAVRHKNRELLARAQAIPASELGERDAVTLALFVSELETDIAVEVCEIETWMASVHANPISGLNRIPDVHKLRDAGDAANLLARYRAMPGLVDEVLANLEQGVTAGRFADAESVRRLLALVDGQLGTKHAEWALMKPIEAARKVLDAQAADAFARELTALVTGDITAAFQRYRAFIATRIVPRARTGSQAGVHGLPGGKACYQALIRQMLAEEHKADELHELGLAEIRRLDGEIAALGKKLFGTANLAEVLRRLRSDPAMYFTSSEEIVAEAERALAAAQAAAPQAFGKLPKVPCVVAVIPDYEAPFTTTAYYRAPHYDGSKPGQYFVNTYQPQTRPRFELRVLSFHEAVPGHHLQIALAQELPSVAAFRRFGGNTAFVEGWALYTERLSGELGLYETDLDRMGMLSYDAWRAARLVVDTGIHAKGWTREQAEAFMREHTALSVQNISNEVDRYISMPAQALAYKVGQLAILNLRKQAETALGPRFSLAAFHDAVLSQGAVTLPVLRTQIEAWMAAQSAAN